MNNKSILTILIATLLALLCAFLIMKKNDIKTIEKEDINIQNEITISDEQQSEETTEQVVEKDSIIDTKPVFKAQETKPTIEIKEEKKETIIEKTTIQEGGVVEEVEDHGIRRNDDGTYEITREFKMKSPRKYSFVDFGFLEKVSK